MEAAVWTNGNGESTQLFGIRKGVRKCARKGKKTGTSSIC